MNDICNLWTHFILLAYLFCALLYHGIHIQINWWFNVFFQKKVVRQMEKSMLKYTLWSDCLVGWNLYAFDRFVSIMCFNIDGFECLSTLMIGFGGSWSSSCVETKCRFRNNENFVLLSCVIKRLSCVCPVNIPDCGLQFMNSDLSRMMLINKTHLGFVVLL
jgi:hypothetical protein